MPLWHHLPCLFTSKYPVTDLSLVKGTEDIRPDDFDRLKALTTKATGKGQGGGSKGDGGHGGGEGSYVVDYAKSGRSSCVVCDEKIDKDVVRVGRMERSERFDGLTPRWTHLTCAMGREGEKIESADVIEGLDDLRVEDQQDVRDVVAGNPVAVRVEKDEDEKPKTKGKKKGRGKRARKDEEEDEEEEEEEEAPKKKGKKRGKKVVKEEEDAGDGDAEMKEATPAYSTMSAAQLKEACKAAGLPASGTKAALIDRLTEHGEASAPSASSSSPPPSSSPSSSSPSASSPAETEFERQLKEEAALRWSIRDPLKSSLSTSQMKSIVAALSYPTSGGPDRLLDTLTDLMMYGRPPPCPDCGKVGVYYKDGAYRCGGFANEWARCGWKADDVTREEFVVPEGWEDVAPFDDWKWEARKKPVDAHRAKAQKVAAGAEEAARQMEVRAEAKAKREKEEEEKNVLMGLKVALHGKEFTVTPAELKGLITGRGGEVMKAAKGADLILSTEEAVKEGKGKVLKDAASASIVVVKEEWLHDSLAKADMQPIQSYVLAQADGVNDLTKAIDEYKAQRAVARSGSGGGGKSSGLGGKSGGKSGKIKLKKGARAAVDGDSELDETGHILEESATEIYAVTMSSADVQSGHNSYYLLQLIEADSMDQWYIFRKWGRLGTTQGGKKLELHSSKAAAKAQFEELYLDKTGNRWSERATFRKLPGKFTVLEQDYTDVEGGELAGMEEGESHSQLPASVQGVVRMLFDVKAMQRTLLEMDIDLEKMPLGKLSKAHIQKGYNVLTVIQQLIQTGTPQEGQLVAACNQLSATPHSTRLDSLLSSSRPLTPHPVLPRLSVSSQVFPHSSFVRVEGASYHPHD